MSEYATLEEVQRMEQQARCSHVMQYDIATLSEDREMCALCGVTARKDRAGPSGTVPPVAAPYVAPR